MPASSSTHNIKCPTYWLALVPVNATSRGLNRLATCCHQSQSAVRHASHESLTLHVIRPSFELALELASKGTFMTDRTKCTVFLSRNIQTVYMKSTKSKLHPHTKRRFLPSTRHKRNARAQTLKLYREKTRIPIDPHTQAFTCCNKVQIPHAGAE